MSTMIVGGANLDHFEKKEVYSQRNICHSEFSCIACFDDPICGFRQAKIFIKY